MFLFSSHSNGTLQLDVQYHTISLNKTACDVFLVLDAAQVQYYAAEQCPHLAVRGKNNC